ncbi:MAG: ABC transporter substrate-binding protein [Kofleriaceae bacterium]
MASCDSPARVKPWRHAPDPTAEAAHAPVSPALANAGSVDVRAARDHTLRIHLDAEPGRLSPVVSPSLWAKRITVGPIFETLIRYLPPDTPNGAGRYAPGLARSWRVAPNGLEIRIDLEPQVTFHNGYSLTSSDVQFTLDSVRDPRRRIDHLRPMLEDVEAVELVTSRELRIRLKRPSGWVLRALAEIPILCMPVYDGSLLAGGALVGTGPWKYTSHKNGVVHLSRNEKYWGGKVAIADVEFVYQPDAAVALREAKRGELDIVPALIPAHWPEQASAPGIAASFKPLELAPPRMRYIAFNATHAPLDDARVRHALALLIDRRTIAKRVFDGLARPALWPIWPGGFVHGAEPAVPDFDPAAAAKLLDAAGWTDSDKDGIRDRAGAQFRITMLGLEKPVVADSSGPPPKIERDYFVEAARRIGVVIDVKTAGEAYLVKRIDEGTYDLIELAWTGRVDMDLGPLVGPRAANRAPSPQIDRVLDAMAAAWDPAERSKQASDLASAFQQIWPLAGIVAEAPQGLVHRRVQNVHVWDGWIDLAMLTLEPAK